jgi:macrolide-specific efflux system membrane fusion protein
LLSKPFIIGVVVVVVAAGVGTFFLTRGDAASVSYRTGVATLGTITQTVSLSGNLAPDGETDLDFEGAGKVTSVNVQPGQTVTVGEVLATQDPTTVDASLTQAEATLSAAEANLTQARSGTTASSLTQAEGQVNSSYVSYQTATTSLADTKAVNAEQVAQAYAAYTTAKSLATADGCTPGDTTPPCPQDEAAISQDYQAWQAAEVKGAQSDDQAQGQVNADKVQWENAKASLTALENGSASSTTQVSTDQSQVEIDQVNVTNAQAAVNAATLKAPTGGLIEEVNVTNGQQISSSGRGRGRRVQRGGGRQGDRGRRGRDGNVGRRELPGHGGAERRQSLAATRNVRVGERHHQSGRWRHHGSHQRGAHHRRREHGHAVRERQAGSRGRHGGLGRRHADPDPLRGEGR